MAQIDKVLLIDADIMVDNVIIDCEIELGAGGRLPNYDGYYIVTPKITEQKLDTKNKSMIDDVTVLEIPTDEVGNEFGTTFAIARE